MAIRTKILASQLPREIQKEYSNYIQDGFMLGDFDFTINESSNKPNYAYFTLSEDGRHFIEIDLLKLLAFTHLLHRWHCLVATGIDREGNKIFKHCEIAFKFVTV